ncbi:MAG: stage III sporulation protein AG [Lachnospiraceae bacterium]|nr:stage III sporulation protein AG [Lachnospiraceae bacterium]
MKEKLQQSVKKYATRDNLLILALLGILLMVIAVPVGTSEGGTKEEGERTPQADAEDRYAGTEEGYAASYEQEMEKQLEELLESMEGVGNVKVMITLAASDERVILKDYDISEEQDASRIVENTVFYTDENGRENPYCQKIITPRVEGVVVVAEGGDDPRRIIEITDVIQSLFDVPVHKIRVVRMKSE